MSKSLEKIEKYLVFLITLISPILVLPIFPDLYNTPKLIFLSGSVLVLILNKSAQIIASKKLEISTSSFDLQIILLAISYLASAIIKSPNKTEAFFFPGTATLITFTAIYSFFVNQSKKTKLAASYGLISSGLLTAIVSLVSVTGLNQKLPLLPDFTKQENFNLAGNNLSTLLFLVTIIPVTINAIIVDKKIVNKLICGISLLFISASVAGNLYQILPGKKFSPKMPPTIISWQIAIDSIKESPLLGIGAGNYLTAFNRFRPLAYNSLEIWQTKFTNSQNFFLHMLTETGILGLFAITMLGIALIKAITQKRDIKIETNNENEVEIDFLKVGLAVSLASLFLSGPNLINLVVFFTYLALNSENKKITFSFEAAQKEQVQTSVIASLLVSLPPIIGALVILYFGSQLVSAEYSFKQGLDAIYQNKGQEAFNNIFKAVGINPKSDRYHITLAQLSFLAAQSIAQNKEPEKITEDEKNTINQLIQQAITEGKAAVSLNPQRADNWELLGNLYKQIMAFAQQADKFAIQSLNQATALDPINPLLRINLGNVYFAIGDYENAVDTFKLAVLAKPDYANARYNLAIAYREKGDIEKALIEIKNALSLIDNESDKEIIQKEIESLESKRKGKEKEESKEEQKKTESLTPPEKNQNLIEPKVDLPEEAAPPSSITTPNPTN